MNDFEYIVCLVQNNKRTYFKSEKLIFESEFFGTEKIIKFVDLEEKAKKFRKLNEAIRVMNSINGSFIIVNLRTKDAFHKQERGTKNECKRIY